MKFAVGGKGGTGKTTFAGTLARALAMKGRDVVDHQVGFRGEGAVRQMFEKLANEG